MAIFPKDNAYLLFNDIRVVSLLFLQVQCLLPFRVERYV